MHFLKTRYGLYKNNKYSDKRVKDDVYKIINYIRYEDTPTLKNDFKKRPKTLFYKKFNKLFFRAGRSVLLDKFNYKKTIIQKYLSKKIHHFIKKPDIKYFNRNNMTRTLIKCNLFYTENDARFFINNFGIKLNDNIIYDADFKITPKDFFAIVWTSLFFKFFKKKKSSLVNNLKKIKVYKFRLKHFLTKKRAEWVPIKTWLLEYSCLYISKYNNIEFDIKSFSGFYLYNNNFEISCDYFYNSDVSIFMSRSYTWKYII